LSSFIDPQIKKEKPGEREHVEKEHIDGKIKWLGQGHIHQKLETHCGHGLDRGGQSWSRVPR